MPRLPQATDLNGVSPQSARSFVDQPVPDYAAGFSAVAGAVKDVGAGIDAFASAKIERQRKQERFDTKMALIGAEEAHAKDTAGLDPLDPQFPEKVRASRRERFKSVLEGIKDPETRQSFEESTYIDYVNEGLKAESAHKTARRGKAKLDIASYYGNVQKRVSSGTYKGDPIADLRSVIGDNTDISDLDRIEIENEVIPAIALSSVQRTATSFLDSGVALTPEVSAAIDAVSKTPGMPAWLPEYLARTATLESSGGRDTVNEANDGVGGVFQFDERTARDVGMSPEDRFDVAKSTAGAAKLAMGRFNELKNTLGRDPTMSEVYLSHQQGAAGASKLLLNPDAPAASIIGDEAVIDNGGWEGMTAEQFITFQGLKYEGGDAPDDPDEVRALLGTNPAFESLSPEGAEAAVKYAIELGSARERQQREEVKLQREEIYREFSDLDASNGLTQDWIDTQKDAGVASAREIRIFENTLRNSKKNIPDDKDEVASIVSQVNNARSDDDVNEAQIAIDEAYAEGKVSNQTKARIAAGIKARRGAVKEQNEYVTRGEKIISRAVRSRDYSSGDLAEDEVTEMAGKIAFQNWLEKNKNATELQIVTEAGKIAKQAAIDRVETVRASIDLPRGLTGRSRKTVTREDIFAYAAGMQRQSPIPGREEDYLREVELLKKWIEIIDIQDMAGSE